MNYVDIIASVFNAFVFLAIGGPLFLVAILPVFKTGFTFTLGLGAVGLSLIVESVWVFNGIEPWEMVQINRLWVIQTGALTITAYGYWRKMKRTRGKHRRTTDFMFLDERAQTHVTGGRNAQH